MTYIDLYGVELHRITPEVREWLLNRMGTPGEKYTIRGDTVYFYEETDRLIFLLNFE